MKNVSIHVPFETVDNTPDRKNPNKEFVNSSSSQFPEFPKT